MQIYWIRAQAPRRVLAVAKHLGFHIEYIEKDLMAGAMKKAGYTVESFKPEGGERTYRINK